MFLHDNGELGNLSLTGFNVHISRHYSKYLIVYYLPSSLFVLVSWTSFIIPPQVAFFAFCFCTFFPFLTASLIPQWWSWVPRILLVFFSLNRRGGGLASYWKITIKAYLFLLFMPCLNERSHCFFLIESFNYQIVAGRMGMLITILLCLINIFNVVNYNSPSVKVWIWLNTISNQNSISYIMSGPKLDCSLRDNKSFDLIQFDLNLNIRRFQ